MGNTAQFFVGKKTYDLDMQLRKSDSYFYIRKFGKIDSTILSTKQDIWNINNSPDFSGRTTYNWIDTAGGVPLFAVCNALGANQLVNVTLLNSAGEQVQIPLVLNGQTPVPIGEGANFTRHQTTSIITLKSNPVPGDVYIFAGTATAGVPDDVTKVYGFVKQGENRTQQGVFTVPLTHYAFFTNINAYFIKKQSAISVVEFEASFPFGNGIPFDLTDFPSKQTDQSLQATVTLNTVKPDFDREFKQSPEIDPGTDMIFAQTADIAGAGLAIEFDLICIKKELYGLE